MTASPMRMLDQTRLLAGNIHSMALIVARDRARTRRQYLAAAVLWVVLIGLVVWLRRTGDEAPAPYVDVPGATRVLFVGNSYTYVNDLPRTFAQVAASLGVPSTVDMIAPGGFTLEQHSGHPVTRQRIQSRAWDFVVLQEQSQRSAFDERQVAREVIPAAIALDSLVHQSSPGARTVFYETWGRRDGDQENCKPVPRVCTYAGMQERVTDTYAELGRRTGAVVAPVGRAWAGVRRTHPEVNLYQPDGSHPSPQGTYLAACVFVAAIFGKSPVGATPLQIPASDAAVLQRAAEETVLTGRRQW